MANRFDLVVEGEARSSAEKEASVHRVLSGQLSIAHDTRHSFRQHP